MFISNYFRFTYYLFGSIIQQDTEVKVQEAALYAKHYAATKKKNHRKRTADCTQLRRNTGFPRRVYQLFCALCRAHGTRQYTEHPDEYRIQSSDEYHSIYHGHRRNRRGDFFAFFRLWCDPSAEQAAFSADDQFTPVVNAQPGPPRAENADGRVEQLLFESVHRAVLVKDELF